MAKGFEYLTKGSDDTEDTAIEIIKDWEKLQCSNNNECKGNNVKSRVGFQIENIAISQPTLTKDDVTVCKRGESIEVWAHRNFSAGEIIIAPETQDVKDRYWTTGGGRNILIQDSALLHPEKKHLVLDGSRRAIPCEVRPFALFFAVERAESEEGANLKIAHAKMHGSITIDLPEPVDSKKRKLAVHLGSNVGKGKANHISLVEIPVLTNAKKIKAGTKLVAEPDTNLKKLHEKLQASKAAASATENAKPAKTVDDRT